MSSSFNVCTIISFLYAARTTFSNLQLARCKRRLLTPALECYRVNSQENDLCKLYSPLFTISDLIIRIVNSLSRMGFIQLLAPRATHHWQRNRLAEHHKQRACRQFDYANQRSFLLSRKPLTHLFPLSSSFHGEGTHNRLVDEEAYAMRA